MRPLWRFALRPVVLVAILGVALYVLLPQIGSLRQSIRSLGDAQWWMLPIAITLSVFSFVGAAVSLSGATVLPLRFWRTVEACLASTFAGRLAPANVGSLGTLAAYLHRQGASAPEATASMGLTLVAGAAVHVLALVLAAAAVGQVPHHAVQLPHHWVAALLIVAVLAAAGVVALAFTVRRRPELSDRIRHSVREGWDGLTAALRSPQLAGRLIGGSMLITMSQIGTLYISLLALRAHTALVTVGFVYLAGSAVGAVAPTPGGLGAVEAAIVSGLTLFGTAGAPAIAAVLLYRLITFWAPIVPGAVAFRILRQHQQL